MLKDIMAATGRNSKSRRGRESRSRGRDVSRRPPERYERGRRRDDSREPRGAERERRHRRSSRSPRRR